VTEDGIIKNAINLIFSRTGKHYNWKNHITGECYNRKILKPDLGITHSLQNRKILKWTMHNQKILKPDNMITGR
jgi:hypothetical protein